MHLKAKVGFLLVFGLLTLISTGLLFVLHIPVTDLRLSTQFQNDMNTFETQPLLIDDFQTYQNTQRINIDGPNDLSEYSAQGMIAAWADVEDYSQIDSIDLELRDPFSSYTLPGIDNKPELPRTRNGIWTDDEFVDYSFNCNQSNSVWRDYMLVNGENMVFWEWNELIPISMHDVVVRANYPIRDAFIMKGFCKYETPTHGNWTAPNGLIQYGFHYVLNGHLFMKNVRQEQMVTNGDHVRIISSTVDAPDAFIMRVQFSATNVQTNPTKNDYVRIAWDFEDEWDPGHDQTAIYLTHEYQYFGMQRVYPIIRQKEQGYEDSPKARFEVENDRLYEINVRVRGQTAKSTIYERRFGLLLEKASIEYTFETPRPTESYPFAIEATGNPNLRVDCVEVWEIVE